MQWKVKWIKLWPRNNVLAQGMSRCKNKIAVKCWGMPLATFAWVRIDEKSLTARIAVCDVSARN